MPRTLFALLVVAVATAGCTGVAPTADAPTPSSDACLPTDLPDAAADRDLDAVPDAPSGVTVDGVTDPRRLAVAHFDALSDRSFTAHTTFEITRENQSQTSTRCVFADDASGQFYLTANSSPSASPDGRTGTSGYSDGDVTTIRTHYGNGTADTTRQPAWDAPVAPSTLIDRSGLYQVLSTTNTTLTGVAAADGRTLYYLEQASTRETTNAPARTVRLRAIVDERGVVRRLTVSRRIELRDGVQYVNRTTRFGRIGETAVPRPEWFAADVKATPGTAANATAANGTAPTTNA